MPVVLSPFSGATQSRRPRWGGGGRPCKPPGTGRLAYIQVEVCAGVGSVWMERVVPNFQLFFPTSDLLVRSNKGLNSTGGGFRNSVGGGKRLGGGGDFYLENSFLRLIFLMPVHAYGYSPTLAGLIKSLLARLPNDRPTAAEALRRLSFVRNTEVLPNAQNTPR